AWAASATRVENGELGEPYRRMGRDSVAAAGIAEVVTRLAVPGAELADARQVGHVPVRLVVDFDVHHRRLARGQRALDRRGDVLGALHELAVGAERLGRAVETDALAPLRLPDERILAQAGA